MSGLMFMFASFPGIVYKLICHSPRQTATNRMNFPHFFFYSVHVLFDFVTLIALLIRTFRLCLFFPTWSLPISCTFESRVRGSPRITVLIKTDKNEKRWCFGNFLPLVTEISMIKTKTHATLCIPISLPRGSFQFAITWIAPKTATCPIASLSPLQILCWNAGHLSLKIETTFFLARNSGKVTSSSTSNSINMTEIGSQSFPVLILLVYHQRISEAALVTQKIISQLESDQSKRGSTCGTLINYKNEQIPLFVFGSFLRNHLFLNNFCIEQVLVISFMDTRSVQKVTSCTVYKKLCQTTEHYV